MSFSLTLELLDAGVPLAGHERKRHDAGHVHLRAEDVHVEVQLLANGLNVLKTLLVVGAGAAHPDRDLVLDQQRGDLAERTDDTLEGGGDLRRKMSIPVKRRNSRTIEDIRKDLRW